jgi:hypothetical protein
VRHYNMLAQIRASNAPKIAKKKENNGIDGRPFQPVVVAITGAACAAKAGTVGPITAADVLKRLQAAFALAHREHVAQLLGCRVFEAALDLEAAAEFEADGKVAKGYSVDPLPAWNRDSGGPLERGELRNPRADERKRARKWDKKVADRDEQATAFLAQHDGHDSKQGTFDLDDMIERTRRRIVRMIRKDPTIWSRLTAIRDRWPDLKPTDRNADRRAFESLGWIENVEADPDLETDRLVMTDWLRSGLEWNAYAALVGMSTSLARCFLRRINAYCKAILARITYATPPRLQNNSTEHAVIRGVPDIAFATGKRTSAVERWIESGHKPIAPLAGQPAMLRALAA